MGKSGEEKGKELGKKGFEKFLISSLKKEIRVIMRNYVH